MTSCLSYFPLLEYRRNRHRLRFANERPLQSLSISLRCLSSPRGQPEVLTLKHKSRILGQWSNPPSPCIWFKEEPSQFSRGQTAQSLTWRNHMHECPRILFSCFRARNPEANTAKTLCIFLSRRKQMVSLFSADRRFVFCFLSTQTFCLTSTQKKYMYIDYQTRGYRTVQCHLWLNLTSPNGVLILLI